MVAELLAEIEEEAAASRGGRSVKGAEAVQAQDPCQQLPNRRKKSPAPMLFFSKQPEVRKAMSDDYKIFREEYMFGSKQLVEAAEQGYRLDSDKILPNGSFAPPVVERILAFTGFNPEAAFPKGCFPRAWPFVGGELPSPPPTPPSRTLIIEKVEGRLRIVHRGEIPTVCVPCRADVESLESQRLSLMPRLLEKRLSEDTLSRDPP